MDRDLRRRQPPDEPTPPDIHARELEHISQERAISFRIRAVDDGMSADDHDFTVSLCQAPAEKQPDRPDRPSPKKSLDSNKGNRPPVSHRSRNKPDPLRIPARTQNDTS